MNKISIEVAGFAGYVKYHRDHTIAKRKEGKAEMDTIRANKESRGTRELMLEGRDLAYKARIETFMRTCEITWDDAYWLEELK